MLSLYRNSVTDFLALPPSGVADTLEKQAGQPAPRHILRQYAYTSAEVLAIFPQRLATNRGNGYIQPLALRPARPRRPRASSAELRLQEHRLRPAEPGAHRRGRGAPGPGAPPPDVNSGEPADAGFAPCLIAPNWAGFGLNDGRAPIVRADR